MLLQSCLGRRKGTRTTMCDMLRPRCSRRRMSLKGPCKVNASGRHLQQNLLDFLRHTTRNTPQASDGKLVRHNDTNRKHAKVKTWLARRPHYHVHDTPPEAAWINQVERWFAIVTQRGFISSLKQLIDKINRFVINYNMTTRPFAWPATGDSIIAKTERSGTLAFGVAR